MSNYRFNESQTNKAESKKEFSAFKVLVETAYKNSIDYIQRNPAKVFWGGAASIAFSFMFGYIRGTNVVTDNMVRSVNSGLSAINRQNFEIMNKLDNLAAIQYNLNKEVEDLKVQSKSRLNTIENKIQFKEAVQKGEEHVKKMEKKKGLKKLLPWNWF